MSINELRYTIKLFDFFYRPRYSIISDIFNWKCKLSSIQYLVNDGTEIRNSWKLKWLSLDEPEVHVNKNAEDFFFFRTLVEISTFLHYFCMRFQLIAIFSTRNSHFMDKYEGHRGGRPMWFANRHKSTDDPSLSFWLRSLRKPHSASIVKQAKVWHESIQMKVAIKLFYKKWRKIEKGKKNPGFKPHSSAISSYPMANRLALHSSSPTNEYISENVSRHAYIQYKQYHHYTCHWESTPCCFNIHNTLTCATLSTYYSSYPFMDPFLKSSVATIAHSHRRTHKRNALPIFLWCSFILLNSKSTYMHSQTQQTSAHIGTEAAAKETSVKTKSRME